MKYVIAVMLSLFAMQSYAFDGLPSTIDCVDMQHRTPGYKQYDCTEGVPSKIPFEMKDGSVKLMKSTYAIECNHEGFCQERDTGEYGGSVSMGKVKFIYAVLPRFYYLGFKANGDAFAYHRSLEAQLKQVQREAATTGQVAGVKMEPHTGEVFNVYGDKVVFDWEWAMTSENPAYNGPGTYAVECDESSDCWMTGGENPIKVSYLDLLKYVPIADKGYKCDEYLCYDGGFTIGLNPETYAQFAVK